MSPQSTTPRVNGGSMSPEVDAVSLSSPGARAKGKALNGTSVAWVMTPEGASSAFCSVVDR